MIETHDMLEFVKAACCQAGEIVRGVREQADLFVEHKPNDGIVTAADVKSHNYLTQALKTFTPGVSIVSEEGQLAEAESDFCWLIDPLDGTMNFAHGLDHVAISVGLLHKRKPILGVVHAPFYGHTYSAAQGKGAFRNGISISVRERSAELSLLAVGFPHDRSDISPIVDRLKPLLATFGDVRRLAAPALDVCWVADGRLDAFIDRVQPWDVAAATVIAREAGAVVSLLSGDIEANNWDGPDDYVVSNPSLHRLVIHSLQERHDHARLRHQADS